MKWHLGGQLARQVTNHSGDNELNVSFHQLSVETCCVTGDGMEGHLLMFPRQPIDAGRYDRNAKRIGSADAQLARRRIGQEVDVLNALAQIVEDRDTALLQSKTEGGRHDAASTAVNEAYAERTFQFCNRLGY